MPLVKISVQIFILNMALSGASPVINSRKTASYQISSILARSLLQGFLSLANGAGRTGKGLLPYLPDNPEKTFGAGVDNPAGIP